MNINESLLLGMFLGIILSLSIKIIIREIMCRLSVIDEFEKDLPNMLKLYDYSKLAYNKSVDNVMTDGRVQVIIEKI